MLIVTTVIGSGPAIIILTVVVLGLILGKKLQQVKNTYVYDEKSTVITKDTQAQNK